MAKSFLKLDTRRPLKDGTYPVRVAVAYGTNLYLPTGLSVAADQWDADTGRALGPGAKRINDVLSTFLCRVQNTILDLRENGRFHKLTAAQLKDILLNAGKEDATPKPITFYDVADSFLTTKSGKRTIELYRQTIKKMQGFAGDGLLMEEIKPNWLREFEVYLGGSINGRSIHLRNIRAVFNYALDEEITTAYPFRKFKIRKEDTRKRSLTIEQLRQYLNLDDLSDTDREYRDMFLLTFYLIGINIVDLARLTSESIVGGRIEYRRAKTGKLYSIKIEPEAQAILDKYKGKKYLLSMFDRCTNVKAYQGTLDNALARIGVPDGDEKHKNGQRKMIPIDKKLTWYWARYSWATYAAELDIPKDTISEALGHSHGAKVTGIYIKYNRDKVDAANRKVIDYVLKKNEFFNL